MMELPHERLDPFLPVARRQIAENLDVVEARFRVLGREGDADDVMRFTEEVRRGAHSPRANEPGPPARGDGAGS